MPFRKDNVTSAAPTLTFLGATGTVTGSKYLLEVNGLRLLVDCGLFQGRKLLRQRNWQPLPFDASSLDAVLLTHAHLDHSGYLPVLRKRGFTGPVYCTSGTAALARILLPDSGYLQEEDAHYANRKGFSRHRPAEPLYTKAEADACLDALRPIGFHQPVHLGGNVTATFYPAGHILGAAWIQLVANARRITFSGDVGRPHDPVLNAPAPLRDTDYLVVESTYGNRQHGTQSPLNMLRSIVNQTVRRKGIVIIPAFAVGRAQTILHLLATLRAVSAIPEIPVFLNSPMAINATDIFCDHTDEHRLTPNACRDMCAVAEYINSADDSRALNRRNGPMIVISASGMATGGRILHHFKAWLGDARNTVLFTGFQAAGTRGAAMVAGVKSLKIHGQSYDVIAEVTEMTSLSAHADSEELIDWMAPLKDQPPKTVFITHGEPAAAEALRERLRTGLGVNAEIPSDGQQRVLS
jgi:metallo-beta-lactamase family protein